MSFNKKQGYTLLEVMIAVAIFTIVMGVLYTLSFTLGRTQRIQDAKFQASQEARRAVIHIMPDLQQASRSTITINDDEDSISYRIPTDLSGNGIAVDASGNLELSGVRTIQVNENNQLVMIIGDETRVIANNVNPGREIGTGANRAFTADDDTNGNGRQDLGFNVWRAGSRLNVRVQTLVTSSDRFEAAAEMQQVISPRNR